MSTISGASYISGGTFNFSAGGYIPPSWSGSEYNFGGSVEGTINQVWADSDYVYTATTEEFTVFDGELKSAYITYSGGFTTIWANDDTVFLGTNNGAKYVNKSCISGSTSSPYDLSHCLNNYVSIHGATSDNIRYIHGNDDLMMWCTDSGIDVYKLEPYGFRSYTAVSDTRKCFMTSEGTFYYTISGSEWSLNRVDSHLTNWSTPDYTYTAGGSILASGIDINDIFVTESTSSGGLSNVVFVATSSGVYVIDEETDVSDVYYIDTSDFTSIWADTDTALSTGRFYTSTATSFNVIKDGVLVDYYTQTHAGVGSETLLDENIIDTTVV